MVKLCIFGALVAGYPLPELSWDLLRGTEATPAVALTEEQGTPTNVNTLAAMDSLLAQSGQAGQPERAGQAAPSRADAATPPTAPALREDPQGSAAARAAAALGSATPSARTLSAPKGTPSAASALSAEVSAPLPTPAPVPAPATAGGPVADASAANGGQAAPGTKGNTQPAAGAPHPLMTSASVADTSNAAAPKEDKSWWSHIQQLKALPFPRMGLDQVAHAATLDTPPPPTVPAPGNAAGRTSAFTPPAQIPSGLNPDGTPIPPRASTAQPLPAGAAGPQFDAPASSIPSLLTPSTNTPAPRTDTFVAPEDPNRKQQELARREQEVLVLKQQMEQRLQELQAAERKVQGLLDEAKEVEAKKISRLSAMYINMKPKQAAKALESMDERTAVKILAGMSPKQSGEILTYADPVKTAKLTELISRMRSGQ